MVLVVKQITRSGWSGERIHDDTGEFSRTEEQSFDTSGSKSDRTRDAIVDIVNRGGGNVVISQSVYDRTRQELGWDYAQSYSGIRVVPDTQVAEISGQGRAINENIEARKAAIQEQRRQSFEPSSLTGRENIERSMLAEKATTDYTPSFAGIVERNQGVREKLEQAGVLSYEVDGKTFSKREMAEGYASQKNREADKAAAEVQAAYESDRQLQRQKTERWRGEVGNPYAPSDQMLFKDIMPDEKYDPKYGKMVRDTHPQRTPAEQAAADMRGVSNLLQGGLEAGIDAVPLLPQPAKEVGKGAGSVVTGIPAFAGDIIQGSEAYVKDVGAGKKTVVGGAFQQAGLYGAEQLGGLGELAQENPAKAAGAVGAMLFGGKAAGKLKKAGAKVGEAVRGEPANPLAGNLISDLGEGRVAGKAGRGDIRDIQDWGVGFETEKPGITSWGAVHTEYGGKLRAHGVTTTAAAAAFALGARPTRATPTENQLKAYETVVDYSTGKPEVLGIKPPESPSRVSLNLDQDAAVEFSKGLSNELKAQGMSNTSVDRKGRVVRKPEGFSVQAADEVLIEPDYFNRVKAESRSEVRHRKDISIGDEEPGIRTYKPEEIPKGGKKNQLPTYEEAMGFDQTAAGKLLDAFISKVEVPTSGGKRTVWRGITVKNRPIIGKGEKTSVGYPEELNLEGIESGYVPVTKLETNILTNRKAMEKARFSPAEIEKIEVGTSLMKDYATQKSVFTEKKLLEGTKSLSKKGTRELLTFVKSRKGEIEQLYGSYSANPQMPESLRRAPGDIDIQLSTSSPEAAAAFAKDLAAQLAAKGEKVRIAADKPTLIETYGEKGTHHAVDIHFKGEPALDLLNPVAEGAYGFKFGQKPINIESIPVMRLSEHGLRKGASSMSWREKKISPAEHRVKDIKDFATTETALIESSVSGVNALNPVAQLKASRSRARVERWKELYPEVDWTTQEPVEMKIPISPEQPGQSTGALGKLARPLTLPPVVSSGTPPPYKNQDSISRSAPVKRIRSSSASARSSPTRSGSAGLLSPPSSSTSPKVRRSPPTRSPKTSSPKSPGRTTSPPPSPLIGSPPSTPAKSPPLKSPPSAPPRSPPTKSPPIKPPPIFTRKQSEAAKPKPPAPKKVFGTVRIAPIWEPGAPPARKSKRRRR